MKEAGRPEAAFPGGAVAARPDPPENPGEKTRLRLAIQKPHRSFRLSDLIEPI